MYILDTSFIVSVLRNKSEAISISEKLTEEVYTIDEPAALEYGNIKASLTKKGEKIGDNNTWIAAICKVNGAQLVTMNRKHFREVRGLKIL